MKKSGKCPKCDSREVYNNEEGAIRTENSGKAIGTWSQFRISTYICTNCGFIEEYMQNVQLSKGSKMQKIREKWQKHNKLG